jgi:hypothetical protein
VAREPARVRLPGKGIWSRREAQCGCQRLVHDQPERGTEKQAADRRRAIDARPQNSIERPSTSA